MIEYILGLINFDWLIQTFTLLPFFILRSSGGTPVGELHDREENWWYKGMKRASREEMAFARERFNIEKRLYPLILQAAGYEPIFDEKGNVIDARLGETGRLREEVEKTGLQRELQGLKGEIAISPATERDLATQEAKLREQLRQQFGADYESTTGGRKALADFFNAAQTLRTQERQGEMSMGEALSRASQLTGQGARQSYFTTPYSSITETGLRYQPVASQLFQERQWRWGAHQFRHAQQYEKTMKFGQSLGQAVQTIGSVIGAILKCKVAEVLYGKYSLKTFIIRLYIANHLADKGLWGKFYRVYNKNSESWAKLVKRYKPIKFMAKIIFDNISKKAVEEFYGE